MPSRPLRKLDPLHPYWIAVFLAIAVAWGAVFYLRLPETKLVRTAARVAGYVAFAGMLVPYLHVLRRLWRYRRYGKMDAWLRWHIAASYLAFAALLVHSRAQADTWLYATLVGLVWVVMVTGVIGYYGQKLLYRIMPFLVKREMGRERLEPTRAQIEEQSLALIEKLSNAKPGEVTAPATAFKPLHDYFTRKLPNAVWLFTGQARSGRAENLFRRLIELTESPEKAKQLTELEGLFEARREVNLEHCLHQLGRAWLLVHGPASVGLFVLMMDHVIVSVWHGGY